MQVSTKLVTEAQGVGARAPLLWDASSFAIWRCCPLQEGLSFNPPRWETRGQKLPECGASVSSLTLEARAEVGGGAPLGLDLQMPACASPSDPAGRARPGMGWGSRAVLGVVPRGVGAGGPWEWAGQEEQEVRCRGWGGEEDGPEDTWERGAAVTVGALPPAPGSGCTDL